MATFYLRVEGVNLGNFVFDTNDLSTIRGGGLALLKATGVALQALTDDQAHDVIAISTGASSGLFSFTADNAAQAKQHVDAVRNALSRDPYHHATFVIDHLPASNGDFRTDCEKLIALNRTQQMSSPSFAMTEPRGLAPCFYDGKRPAMPSDPAAWQFNANGDKVSVSASVAARRKFGRDQKQKLYAHELSQLREKDTPLTTVEQALKSVEFAQDFSAIASGSPVTNLNNKLAIFYVDGNSFGTKQRVDSSRELSDWDTQIKKLRRTLLEALLSKVISDSDWYIAPATATDKKIARMETLLWGGDEIIFVVPAWKGLELAQLFFQATESWEYPTGKRLTHAASLVFCHHNAPIHPLRKLVENLASDAKKQTNGRAENSLTYVVLESFDHTGGDFKDYVKRIYGSGFPVEDRTMSPTQLSTLLTNMPALKSDLPRSRLYGHLHALIAKKTDDAQRARADALFSRELPQPTVKAVAAINALCSSGPLAGWAHVTELWDYALPEPIPEPAAANADITATA